MAYHPFERICSLWLERVKHHFVIENFPFRYKIKKQTKSYPSTATKDFDLISYYLKTPKTIYLSECKSNINQTFQTVSLIRLRNQLKDLTKQSKSLPFIERIQKKKRFVFGIKIANRIKNKIPRNVDVKEGETFKKDVLDELILYVGRDPKIDPKDDILSIIRLFWHFGILNDDYYLEIAKKLLKKNPHLSAGKLRTSLGLISYKTDFCKELLSRLKHNTLG
jgi:hypothetical protein